VSGYDLFRRRIAPIAFFAAIALICYDTCHKQERTHTTFVFDFGDARPRVRAIDASIFVDGDDEPAGELHRARLPDLVIDTPRLDTALPADHGRIVITVDVGEPKPRTIERRFVAIEGGTTTVPLARDLASRENH
jgi:hypothetical protein